MIRATVPSAFPSSAAESSANEWSSGTNEAVLMWTLRGSHLVRGGSLSFPPIPAGPDVKATLARAAWTAVALAMNEVAIPAYARLHRRALASTA